VRTFGLSIAPSQFGKRGVVHGPEKTGVGNVVLHVGVESGRGWSKVAHVVLTPTEVRELVVSLGEVLA
jgi:hypothetical protein